MINQGRDRNLQAMHAIFDEVTKSMFGVEQVIRLCLVALCTEGHVLLEGNPGLGKTSLVRALAEALSLPSGRIQFTPDLMPADITGTLMPPETLNSAASLVFKPGPIFTSLLLADEINRATPKTQAAMLEAMAERQVTVLGTTFGLDEHDYVPIQVGSKTKGGIIDPIKDRPFMVLATQNPIDHEGTYDLPKAQTDRFMFKLDMPVPKEHILRQIVEKDAGRLDDDHAESRETKRPTKDLDPDAPHRSVTMIKSLQEAVEIFPMSRHATEHIFNMYLASNKMHGKNGFKSKLSEFFSYGLGPRAATALAKGAKAWTLLDPDSQDLSRADGHALARVVIPTLRHRLALVYDWETRYGGQAIDDHSERKKEQFVAEFFLECIPSDAGREYKGQLAQAIAEELSN